MLSPDLRQQRGFAVRTYTLTDNAVILQHRGMLHRFTVSVPYHLLTEQRFSTSQYSKTLLLSTIATFALGLVGLFVALQGDSEGLQATGLFFGIGAFTAAAFLRSRRQYTGLAGYGTSLQLWPDNPSAEAIEAFLAELLRRRGAYLARVGSLRGASPADQLTKLAALRDRGIISPSEFETLKSRLVRDEQSQPPGGGAA